MSKLFYAIVLSGFFLMGCNQGTETIDTSKHKTLSQENYSIRYPSNWILNRDGQMGTRFILFSPYSSKKDKFRENINLLIQNLKGQKIDLNRFVEISKQQIETMITDGKIIQSRRLKDGIKDHYHIIFSGKQGNLSLKFEQYYWILQEKAYVLTLTTAASEFDHYQRLAEPILKSFQVND